ncbi:MAG: hypothetical protein K0S47_3187 [Herbinix sp.]|jgi:hypothetical protein|nr:hypothetical protein [Herbinix sp.]
MTLRELRNKIYNKYKPGQTINMRMRDVKDEKILKRIKATILRFYPYHVLCRIGGKKECFTYHDVDKFTTYNKG